VSDAPPAARLRQAVLVAADLDAAVESLRAELGLGEPFADPGVAAFGLRNAVFSLGDCFLEVVSPVEPGTAAGRHLERLGGDGGYMVMFQVADTDAARRRVERAGIRVVWRIDLPDISGTHLHPSDVGGAIVSLDTPRPLASWRWGGPDWTGRAGAGAPGRLDGVTIAVEDPAATAERWAGALGVGVSGDGGTEPALDGGQVAFAPADAGPQGLVEIDVALPAEVRRGRDTVELCGVRFRLAQVEAPNT